MMALFVHAMTLPAPAHEQSAVVRVAEGCGNGWWRDPDGRCHQANRIRNYLG